MTRSEIYSDGVLVEVTDLDGTDVVTRDGAGVEVDRRPATPDELAPVLPEPTTVTAQVDVTAHATAMAALAAATTTAARVAALTAALRSITVD